MTNTLNPNLLLVVPLAPLVAAMIAGLFCRVIPRKVAHWITIIGVAVSCGISLHVAGEIFLHDKPVFNGTVYQWLVSDGIGMQVGFLIDRLTALMMCVVTFVSLCVHVYTIGYMADDDGYNRFFSYISLFTFSMLMLVMSNNFMQLFFGWEAVGVVSYLLIGFWYKRPTAIFANLKAFLVNRVGDFGFVLGIAAIVYYSGSLDYADVLNADVASKIAGQTFTLPGTDGVNAMTFICICLFIGAMGKSAQVPLHVWLPDSMEGPTPISALIHAATMVTAGIFMVARMSPLFEFSEYALNFVLFIGATTALFMGFLGIINNDIKRVVAYSTLSQLGYMTVALGVSGYAFGIFHLMTHAFFKALLFLAAGSVIIGMHHEQDMRKMGGLYKYMKVTAITCWIGALALVGTPFFSGFYSKDLLIDAVHLKAEHDPANWIAHYAYFCVFAGVFITAFYTFRMMFMTFHGKPRFDTAPAHDSHAAAGHDDHAHGHHGGPPHESPWVITLPLVALAFFSIVIGAWTVEPLLFEGGFGGSIFVSEAHNVLPELHEEFGNWWSFALHSLAHPVLYLVIAGFLAAYALYIKWPHLPDTIAAKLKPLVWVLENKYGFDALNERLIAPLARNLGKFFWIGGDRWIIDGIVVDGSARTIGVIARFVRRVQNGFLYNYAFWMVIGLATMLGWFLARTLK